MEALPGLRRDHRHRHAHGRDDGLDGAVGLREAPYRHDALLRHRTDGLDKDVPHDAKISEQGVQSWPVEFCA
jgi:hypothetical protein